MNFSVYSKHTKVPDLNLSVNLTVVIVKPSCVVSTNFFCGWFVNDVDVVQMTQRHNYCKMGNGGEIN